MTENTAPAARVITCYGCDVYGDTDLLLHDHSETVGPTETYLAS